MLLGGSEALGKGESARAAAEGQLPGDVLYSRYRPGAVFPAQCPKQSFVKERGADLSDLTAQNNAAKRRGHLPLKPAAAFRQLFLQSQNH